MGCVSFCIGAFSTVLSAASVLYVLVKLRIPGLISNVIFTPAIQGQEFMRKFFFGEILCPIWLSVRIGIRLLKLREGPKHLSKKKSNRREVINSLSAKLCGLKTPLENVDKITSVSMSQLRQHIAVQRDFSSLDVVEALQVHLLRLMQSSSSCIAEVVFDADVTAIVADHALKRKDKPISTLHGIPICLSNCFCVKGEDCNNSVVFKAGYSQVKDCSLVQNLRTIGANPVALATTAPLLGEMDSSSRLYGTVLHPTHPDRVVGSTSIAVIVEQKGAFLGFGLDVLGDVRLAAANVGIVGFKPTGQRLSLEGIANVVNFPEFLPPTAGIVGLRASDIVDAMTELTSIHADLSIPFMPLQTAAPRKILNIGVYSNCPSLIPVVPGVERLLTEVKTALRAKGHNVVEVTLPNPEEPLLLALHTLFSSDSYWNIHVRQHHGCSLTWHEILQCCLPKIPLFLRGPLSLVIQCQQKAKCKKMKRFLKAWRKPFSKESIYKGLEAYRDRFFEWWSDEEVDLLIGPAAASPALLKKSPASLAFLQAGYSTIFNIVNCPAGVVTLGKTTQADVRMAGEVKTARNSLEQQLLKQQATAEGLPLAVQVAARPWADDLVLQAMQELEEFRQP